MWASDCRAINEAYWRDSDRLAAFRAICYVVKTTIRTNTNAVSGHLRGLAEGRSWTMGGTGYVGSRASMRDYLLSPAGRVLWERVEAAITVDDTAGALLELTALPGIGLAKAGFILQLMGVTDVACWDSQNMARIPEAAEILRKLGKPTRETALAYRALCIKHGASEGMWNDWCAYIAAKPGNGKLGGADGVSALHVQWYDYARAYLPCN